MLLLLLLVLLRDNICACTSSCSMSRQVRYLDCIVVFGLKVPIADAGQLLKQ